MMAMLRRARVIGACFTVGRRECKPWPSLCGQPLTIPALGAMGTRDCSTATCPFPPTLAIGHNPQARRRNKPGPEPAAGRPQGLLSPGAHLVITTPATIAPIPKVLAVSTNQFYNPA